MRHLYQGKLPPEMAGQARQELREIAKELESLGPDQIVWDHEDASAKPPWGNRVASTVTNLRNYFRTSNGHDLIDTIEDAFSLAEKRQKVVEVF